MRTLACQSTHKILESPASACLLTWGGTQVLTAGACVQLKDRLAAAKSLQHDLQKSASRHPGSLQDHSTKNMIRPRHSAEGDRPMPSSSWRQRPLGAPHAPAASRNATRPIKQDTSRHAAGLELHPHGASKTHEDGQELCAICLEETPAVVFQPCQHAIACMACSVNIASRTKECPMCRCPIEAAVPLAALP